MKKMMSIIMLAILLLGCGNQTEKESEDTLLIMEDEWKDEKDTKKNDSSKDLQKTEETTGNIFVYVCGQVGNPDVYELPEGSRLCHAIEAAGGMLESADQNYSNQAEVLNDGQKVYIPTMEEVENRKVFTGERNENTSFNGKISINKATKEELMNLSGIGEKRAEAIIAYRESKGGFQSLEEIMQVEGIKEAIFNKFKDQIQL